MCGCVGTNAVLERQPTGCNNLGGTKSNELRPGAREVERNQNANHAMLDEKTCKFSRRFFLLPFVSVALNLRNVLLGRPISLCSSKASGYNVISVISPSHSACRSDWYLFHRLRRIVPFE